MPSRSPLVQLLRFRLGILAVLILMGVLSGTSGGVAAGVLAGPGVTGEGSPSLAPLFSDDGAGVVQVSVVIPGTGTFLDHSSFECDCTEGKDFWKEEFDPQQVQNGTTRFDPETLQIYLGIVGLGSGYFSPALTAAEANSVFHPPKGHDSEGKLARAKNNAEQQALAAWLNFAKGGVDWDELVDTDADGQLDAMFAALMEMVGTILADPDATKSDFEHGKDLAESINVMDEGNPDCESG